MIKALRKLMHKNPSKWNLLPIDIKRYVLVLTIDSTSPISTKRNMARYSLVCKEFRDIIADKYMSPLLGIKFPLVVMRISKKIVGAWQQYLIIRDGDVNALIDSSGKELTAGKIIPAGRFLVVINKYRMKIYRDVFNNVVYDGLTIYSNTTAFVDTRIGLLLTDLDRCSHLLLSSNEFKTIWIFPHYCSITYNGVYFDDRSFFYWTDNDWLPRRTLKSKRSSTWMIYSTDTYIDLVLESFSNNTQFFRMIAYDTRSGKELWSKEHNPRLRPSNTTDTFMIVHSAVVPFVLISDLFADYLYEVYTGDIICKTNNGNNGNIYAVARENKQIIIYVSK